MFFVLRCYPQSYFFEDFQLFFYNFSRKCLLVSLNQNVFSEKIYKKYSWSWNFINKTFLIKSPIIFNNLDNVLSKIFSQIFFSSTFFFNFPFSNVKTIHSLKMFLCFLGIYLNDFINMFCRKIIFSKKFLIFFSQLSFSMIILIDI